MHARRGRGIAAIPGHRSASTARPASSRRRSQSQQAQRSTTKIPKPERPSRSGSIARHRPPATSRAPKPVRLTMTGCSRRHCLRRQESRSATQPSSQDGHGDAHGPADFVRRAWPGQLRGSPRNTMPKALVKQAAARPPIRASAGDRSPGTRDDRDDRGQPMPSKAPT